MTELTRAQRNNNPGNIDRTNIRWLGMAADQSGDPRFIVFVDAAHGFRAMARIIHGHFGQFNTVRQIINRWAPPVENDSQAYVNDVANRMGVTPDRILTWAIDALPLLRAIAIHENGTDENGKCLWPDSVIIDGINMEQTT
jgi:hypothetical protein